MSKQRSSSESEEWKEKSGLTPEDWNRTGWIAVCEKHLGNFYDEERDGYADVCEEAKPLICDMDGCEKEAKYEIIGDLAKKIKDSKPAIKIENENGYDAVLTDSFLDDLRKIEEAEEEDE